MTLSIVYVLPFVFALLIIAIITLSTLLDSPFWARIVISRIRKKRSLTLEFALKEVNEKNAWLIVYQPLSSVTLFLLPYRTDVEQVLDIIGDSESMEECSQEFYIDKNQWNKKELKFLMNFGSFFKKNCYYVDLPEETGPEVLRNSLNEETKKRFLVIHHIWAISM